MKIQIIFLAAIFLLFLFLAGKLVRRRYFGRRANRHRKFIKTGNKVLKKLDGFDGERSAAQKIVYLRQINPLVFEELLLSAFEKKGWRVRRNKSYTGDGGFDGEVWDGSTHYLIQAKRYQEHIKRLHLEDFAALCKKNRTRGLFIHTGKTGKGLLQEFSRQGVEIVSGEKLVSLVSKN